MGKIRELIDPFFSEGFFRSRLEKYHGFLLSDVPLCRYDQVPGQGK